MTSQNSARKSRHRARLFFEWTHRWFGLIAGLHFVLLGLSGSFMVFQDRTAAADTQVSYVQGPVPSGRASLDAAVQAARGSLGVTTNPFRVRILEDLRRNMIVTFDVAPAGQERKLVDVYYDPSTQKVAGSQIFSETWGGRIYTFHHDLLLGKLGRTIMGVSGTLMTLILLTGLYLWWPRKRSWLSALKYRAGRTSLQTNLNLHKIFGVYSALLMLMVTITGVLVAKPEWLVKPKKPVRQQESGALALVNFALVDQTLASKKAPIRPLQTRMNPGDPIMSVTAGEGAEMLEFEYDNRTRMISEKVISRRQPKEIREEVRRVSRWLHGGDFWGFLGRAIFFIAGLLPLFFYATGFYVWWKKKTIHADSTRGSSSVDRS